MTLCLLGPLGAVMQATRGAPAPLTTPAATPAAGGPAPDGRWLLSHYVVKERKFTLGRQYRVFDNAGRLVAYCKQKMFRLREDIRFYADETQQVELFRMQAQKIIDFNASIAVTDSRTGQAIGFLRRRGWKSLFKDEWLVFDHNGNPVGNLHEDSGLMAFLRRFVLRIIPHEYDLLVGPPGAQRKAGEIKERFQVIGDTYDLMRDPTAPVDGRILIGLTICIDALEGQ